MIFIFKEERIFEIYDTVIFGLIRDFEYNLFISSSTKHMLASGVTRTLSNIFLILLVIKEGKKTLFIVAQKLSVVKLTPAGTL